MSNTKNAKATAKASKPAKAAKASKPAKAAKANGKATTKAAATKPTKAPAKAGGVQHPGAAWLDMLNEVGLSQTKAAHEMGVAPMTLNRLCNGYGIPTAKVTVAFAKVVGKDPAAVWRGVCDYELALALADAS